MPIPIIPILALGAIAGGAYTLKWYHAKSQKEREQADRLALKWFGNRFRELAENQQIQIRKYLDDSIA